MVVRKLVGLIFTVRCDVPKFLFVLDHLMPMSFVFFSRLCKSSLDFTWSRMPVPGFFVQPTSSVIHDDWMFKTQIHLVVVVERHHGHTVLVAIRIFQKQKSTSNVQHDE